VNVPLAPIDSVAAFNPSPPKGSLSSIDEVAFVPMAAVSEDGSMAVREHKLGAALSTGYSYFQSGDVLVAKITPCFENNKIVVAHIDREHGFGSTEFHVIRPSPSDLDARYLAYFLRQDSVRELGQKRMTGSAGQRRVPRQFLEQLEIPLPPLDEQRRIAAILDQADALRRKRRDSIKLLDDFPLSLFNRQFGDPTANPRKIRSSYLGEVSEFGSGGTPAKSNARFWNGEFPWVSPKDMKRLRLSRAEDSISEAVFAETSLKKIPPDTPLIVVRGMILAHTVPIAMAVCDLAINQDMKSIHFDDRVLPEFGLWCLKAQHRSILTKVDTAAHGTKRLDSEVLRKLPILLPPLSEQRSFVAGIENWETLRNRLESQAEALESVFASLQHRAFRGEL
jgi:type I restriction enzyme, S subunit